MKKIITVLLVMILMLSLLAGCGEKAELYSDVELSKYMTLQKTDYIGVAVDTKSDAFAQFYDYEFEKDIEEKNLYETVKDGTVQNGDEINLDYSGKVDGKVFEGGTATGQTLVIGSGTFIDDFEEELIGAKVGETRDVTAKFPDSYPNSPDLAGKEAVFTCKINSITRAPKEDQVYKKMGFESVNGYKDDITERAVKSYILNAVCEKTTIKSYPENESEVMLDAIFDQYVDMYKKEYNQDLEELLIQNGLTVEQYKENLRSEVLPTMMQTSMTTYYIFVKEDLELTEEVLEKQEVEQATIKECYAVQEVVLDFLYSKAVIKK